MLHVWSGGVCFMCGVVVCASCVEWRCVLHVWSGGVCFMCGVVVCASCVEWCVCFMCGVVMCASCVEWCVCFMCEVVCDDVFFTTSTIAPQLVKREKAITEGWEYARTVFSSYHVSEHKLDFARRRRWHRKLVQVSGDKPPVFYFETEVRSLQHMFPHRFMHQLFQHPNAFSMCVLYNVWYI